MDEFLNDTDGDLYCAIATGMAHSSDTLQTPIVHAWPRQEPQRAESGEKAA